MWYHLVYRLSPAAAILACTWKTLFTLGNMTRHGDWHYCIKMWPRIFCSSYGELLCRIACRFWPVLRQYWQTHITLSFQRLAAVTYCHLQTPGLDETTTKLQSAVSWPDKYGIFDVEKDNGRGHLVCVLTQNGWKVSSLLENRLKNLIWSWGYVCHIRPYTWPFNGKLRKKFFFCCRLDSARCTSSEDAVEQRDLLQQLREVFCFGHEASKLVSRICAFWGFDRGPRHRREMMRVNEPSETRHRLLNYIHSFLCYSNH